MSSVSFISSLIFSYPKRHPYIARVVCNGLRHVHTFILSTISTTSRFVNITPPSSSLGLPFGKLSSITRYSASSAFTNGATNVFLLVLTKSTSSIPSLTSISITESAGLGVILSIIDHGKLTFLESSTYDKNPLSQTLLSDQFFANAVTAPLSLSPLCEQLSILTMATGSAPALNLS